MPAELLLKIFKLYVLWWNEQVVPLVDRECDENPKYSTCGWVRRITHICYRWRVVALRDPSLWSNVFLTTSPGARIIFDRSGDSYPLSVHRYMGSEDYDHTCPMWFLILRHAHRVSKLTVEIDSTNFPFSGCHPVFTQLEDLTIQRKTTVSASTAPPFAHPKVLPALRRLAVRRLLVPDLQPLFNDRLTHLSLTLCSQYPDPELPWSVFLRIFCSMNNLVQLVLFSALPNDPYGTLHEGAVILPRLRKLQMSDYSSSITDFLRLLSAPSDAFVYIGCWESVIIGSNGQRDLAELSEQLSAALSESRLLGSTARFHCVDIVCEPMPEGWDHTSLYAWQKAYPASDLEPLRSRPQNEEGLPGLQLTSSDLFVESRALVELCQTLPFRDVLTFAVRLGDYNLTPADFIDMSFAMPNVENLLVDSGPANGLCTAFLRIPAIVLFRNLKVLTLEGMRIYSSQQLEEYESMDLEREQLFLDLETLQCFRKALLTRALDRFPLDKLIIKRAWRVDQGDIDTLKEALEATGAVRTIEWDGLILHGECAHPDCGALCELLAFASDEDTEDEDEEESGEEKDGAEEADKDDRGDGMDKDE
ncbi:uncharacterized protein PHACADRAFT_25975 [Phanerochaete carnosa HHB-10118-sp]|uniref:Uncharacterized protein n=1 Tax=Phanerochaete carnosa (strain HHB-10118-sp) TaxID=650164 RepID=K5WKJ3_PHACS|nr:uncharacterized protein PHACADRAFT_25975 [Phanerochaete carnosa HHB-10118-sp]EKM59915.1 hypothetical protein PHACADRAFT_25975 [Phanerochaete carnosa HHB-10118-sp]